jgi:hypothetical protein
MEWVIGVGMALGLFGLVLGLATLEGWWRGYFR